MHLAVCMPLVIQGLPAALAGVTSLRDPLHSLLYWVTTVTFRVQLTLCGPPSSHRRRAVRNGGFRLPSSTPASHSRCLGHLPDCKQVPPRSIYFLLGVFFFFSFPRPPEASFFMNKIWAILLEPWRGESTGSWGGCCFYCCGCWCLLPPVQGGERKQPQALV